ELTLDADGQRLRIDCNTVQKKLPVLRRGHLKQRQLEQFLYVPDASARFPILDNLACACLADAVNALELFSSRCVYIQLAHSRRCSKENRVPEREIETRDQSSDFCPGSLRSRLVHAQHCLDRSSVFDFGNGAVDFLEGVKADQSIEGEFSFPPKSDEPRNEPLRNRVSLNNGQDFSVFRQLPIGAAGQHRQVSAGREGCLSRRDERRITG